MFWSSPCGRAPEVTGPYCSHTRSGALPPEAWLSRVALAAVMLAVLLGSHWTVTFLWAFSYWVVRSFRPALSAAVMAPVLGGSSALMVTVLPLPLPLLPPEEQAARVPAARIVAVIASMLLRMGCSFVEGLG